MCFLFVLILASSMVLGFVSMSAEQPVLSYVACLLCLHSGSSLMPGSFDCIIWHV